MKNEIDSFFRTINELRDSILSIKGTKFLDNHKKTLLLCFIDLMAKAVYRDCSNRKRFVHFVKNYCDWKYANYISLPQLVILVNKDPSEELLELRSFANERINSWPNARPILLNNDLCSSEVNKFWPDNHKTFERYNLDSLTHANLLWQFRNSLVHELRPPGSTMDFFEEKNPHYTQVLQIHVDNASGKPRLNGKHWELTYPLDFFYHLVNNAIKNSKKHFTRKNINPYDNFRFGSEWLF